MVGNRDYYLTKILIMFGLENIFGNKKPEEAKNESAKEVSTEESIEERQPEETIDKKGIGLSPETKERISAKRVLNPDGTVRVPTDETFENDQERAA